MNFIYILVSGCISMCVGIMLKAKIKVALWGALLSGLCYLTFMAVPYEKPAYFLATLLLALLSEIMAKLVKNPSTLFLIMGIYVLVPGTGIYKTFFNIVNGDYAVALSTGGETFVNLALMAVAIALVSIVFGKAENS